MKRSAVALAGLTLLVNAHAALAPGVSGNGELFLNVVDNLAKASYVLDMGILMDSFFVAGQQDIGSQQFWVIDSTAWTSYLNIVAPANLRWSVVAIDSTGPNTAGNQRLFTTVRQGDEANVGNTQNVNFSAGIGAAQAGNFFSTVNTLPAHQPAGDYAINADSFSLEGDAGRAYYGEIGGLTPTYNGAATFNASNAVGASSWFYYLTRSGTSNLASSRVLTDEFDNGDGSNAGSGHDAYWGFTLVSNAASPYDGKYLLSYTLAPRVWGFTAPTASQREFAASIGRTEITAGEWVERLPGVASAAAALENSAGWTTPLGLAGQAGIGSGDAMALLSPVPEPASAALLLAGVGLLWARRAAPQAVCCG